MKRIILWAIPCITVMIMQKIDNILLSLLIIFLLCFIHGILFDMWFKPKQEEKTND